MSCYITKRSYLRRQLLFVVFYFLPKLPYHLLKFLRQVSKSLVFYILGDTVISLGYTACNSGQGVTIAPYGDSQAEGAQQ